MKITAKHQRLDEYRNRKANWKKWGPYLSERSWGTVREDYSADGSAWDYFPHDHARSRAYRWGEDGAAPGITFRTTTPAVGPTAGAKTVSPGSRTAISTSVSP
jgi:hypothetical protein